jgi:hypothetical protein
MISVVVRRQTEGSLDYNFLFLYVMTILLQHLIVYQVIKSEHTLINLVAFVTDPAKEGTRLPGSPSMPCSQREMLAAFEGWDDEVQALLNVSSYLI